MECCEALRQLNEGADFAAPAKLLKPVSAREACLHLTTMPYSIATNVLHADIGNRVWLARLKGEPRVNPFPDFRPVAEADWGSVREDFLNRLNSIVAFALDHPSAGESERRLLLKVAVHTSYHIGQIALLKRSLRLSARHAAGVPL